MDRPREERFDVDFTVQLSWQVGATVRRVMARCVDLSASGAKLETQNAVQPGTTVLVHSEHFGRMGLAVVKYCNRNTMKYEIGVCFGVALQLSDPARRRILEGLIRTPAPAETVPEPEREAAKAMVVKR
jgi:hypothetical protein